MSDESTGNLHRYARQTAFEPLGLDGQRALARGRVLIVGAGGLGSWVAELLARAGVGFLRLVDADRVDLTNLHRQGLYDEADASTGCLKVHAAAARLARLNSNCRVEPIPARLDRRNLSAMGAGIDVIVDGTDNFATRFLINDYCVKTARPWVFAGVVRAEAQIATIIPGRSACLQCLLEEPPAVCRDPSCRQAGVLGPAVSAVASLEAMEAIKLLAAPRQASPYLLKLDLWCNVLQRLPMGPGRTVSPCPCCQLHKFEFLEP